VQLVLGKEYFYANTDHKIRATHGMIYYKEMKLYQINTKTRHINRLYFPIIALKIISIAILRHAQYRLLCK